MATLGELNILINLKGLSNVKKGLEDIKTQTKNTSNEFKSAAESASVFEAAFKSQDKQLKESQKQFNTLLSDLRSTGRNLTQLGNTLRNTGVAITGSFTAAFLAARDTIPQVDAELNKIQTSFRHMSEDIARTAVPSLKEFSGLINNLTTSVSSLVKQNPEVTNFILKFGAFLTAIGVSIGLVGGLFKGLQNILSILKQIGIVTSTGAIAAIVPKFLGWASAATALYLAVRKARQEIDKMANGPLKTVLKLGTMNIFEMAKMAFTGKMPGQLESTPKVDLGSIRVGGAGPHQLSNQELSNSMTNAEAHIQNLNQKAQMAIENTLAMANAIREQVGGVIVSFADGIGQAFARSVVEGENFFDSFVSLMKGLAEQVIAMLTSVIAKILILRSLGVIGPIPATALFGGGGGFGESMGGSPGGKGITGFIRNLIPFAEGGIVTKPTLGLFGESGPEAVVPLDKMNQMGGVNLHIHSDIIFTNDEAALDKFFRKGVDAMKRISSRRTGGTQLAF